MNASARLFLMVVFLGATVMGWGTLAWAQEKADNSATVETPKHAKAPVDAPAKVRKTPDSFERTARLESMRYRHLWLAYGFIWLVVFLFVFRTWKLHQGNSAELEALTRRLKALESDQAPAPTPTSTGEVALTPPEAAGVNDGDT